MNYFNGDEYKGCGFILIIFLVICSYLFGKLAIFIAKPTEFIVTKKMIPVKRIVTDGIKVDTVLVYKLK